MSVLIRGMDLPERCEDCGLIYETEGYCVCPFTKAGVISKHRPSYCPLIPADDVAPRGMGKWTRASKNLMACSACGNCVVYDRISSLFYCPNCGAKMEVGS